MAKVLLERETVEGDAVVALLDNEWDAYLEREGDIVAAKEARNNAAANGADPAVVEAERARRAKSRQSDEEIAAEAAAFAEAAVAGEAGERADAPGEACEQTDAPSDTSEYAGASGKASVVGAEEPAGAGAAVEEAGAAERAAEDAATGDGDRPALTAVAEHVAFKLRFIAEARVFARASLHWGVGARNIDAL